MLQGLTFDLDPYPEIDHGTTLLLWHPSVYTGDVVQEKEGVG